MTKKAARPIVFAIIAVAIAVAAGAVLFGFAKESQAIAVRRQRISQMEADEKALLNDSWERFAALSDVEKEKLRQLDRDIDEDENAKELRNVMRRYYRWSIALPTYQRLELMELSAESRIKHIADIQRETRDTAGLRKWFDARAEHLEEELAKKQQKQLAALGPAGKYFMLFRMLSSMSEDGARAQKQLSDEDLAELRSYLSDQTQRLLESKTSAEQWKLIVDRLRRRIRSEMSGHRFSRIRNGAGGGPFGVADEDLAELFEKLPLKRQDLLLSLPAEEMHQQLQELYLERRFPRINHRGSRRHSPFRVQE